jgi:FixJ family two-component response regulator
MSEPDAMVFAVDDEARTRESLKNLIRSVSLHVEVFASAQDFLRSTRPDVPGCLVLDVRLRGLSGLDLQKRMAGRRRIPSICGSAIQVMLARAYLPRNT